MRNSCDTVATKSLLSCSSARTSEMSRIASTRPGRPSPPLMSAAVTESHSSWPARESRTSVAMAPAGEHALGRAVAVAELTRQELGQHATERAALGICVSLGGRVPEHDATFRVGCDDGIGDAPEDRRNAVLLARDRS